MTSTSSSPAGRRISKAASPPLVPAPTEPPAEPLAFLVADLDSALQALTAPALAQAERTDSFHRARLYLQQVQALATRGVAQGDLTAPRRALEALFAVRPFVDAHYQELSPEPHLALELEAAYCSLAASDEALERLRDQARLADPKRSPVERSVLAVLACEKDVFLRRGEVAHRLTIDPRPSLPGVGLVLERLHAQGFLQRVQRPAQGNPETAFYALSTLGREVWQRLEKLRRVAESQTAAEARRQQICVAALAIVASKTVPRSRLRVAQGLLNPIGTGPEGQWLLEKAFVAAARRSESGGGAVDEVFLQLAGATLNAPRLSPQGGGTYRISARSKRLSPLPELSPRKAVKGSGKPGLRRLSPARREMVLRQVSKAGSVFPPRTVQRKQGAVATANT